MSNSSLATVTWLSPNKTSPRRDAIDRISIHCTAGQTSAETLGAIFASPSRRASSNYGIGLDGRIGMYVKESDASWCTSSSANDNRAVTIEVASDSKHPYAVKDAAYEALIRLCVDICQRNGKSKLLWLEDKDKTLTYNPAPDEMIITVHRWFTNKACPGEWLFSRMGEIARRVTDILEEENMVRYERLSDIKNEGFHEIIEKLMNAEIICGDGSDPYGNNDIIDLSLDMVRGLVFQYRGGAFDRKLISKGMEPAIQSVR